MSKINSSEGPSEVLSLMIRYFKRLGSYRQKQFVMLVVLMVFSGVVEIVNLGLVLPYLGVLISPEKVFDFPLADRFLRFFHSTKSSEILGPLTVLFIAVSLLAGFVRMLQHWLGTRLAYSLGADLSGEIYRRALYQPFSVHVSRHSSEVISGISGHVNQIISWVFQPALTLISSAVLLVAVSGTLLLIHPQISLFAISGFALAYLGLWGLLRRKIRIHSQVTARGQTQIVKTMQESLGGIRDVLLDGLQPLHEKMYRKIDGPLRKAVGDSVFINSVPKIIIESLGISLLVGIAYVFGRKPETSDSLIPILGVLALAAQRILPALQQIFSSWSFITGSEAALHSVLHLLEQPLADEHSFLSSSPMRLSSEVELRDISFSFDDNLPIINKFNFKFNKGSRTAVQGVSGSGKSTLMDILMGLLPPREGRILVDGIPLSPANVRSWQALIAHVPQNLFLADLTVAENIAFGVPLELIDQTRVREVAAKARVSDFIETRPRGYQTLCGERGLQLSGGQRQRIGIARALYKQSSVLILDEATSALDEDTEADILKSIIEYKPDLTLIIVTHRKSTLKWCQNVIHLN